MADDKDKIYWHVVRQGIKFGGVSLGLIYFIILILVDNWSALKSKPRTSWIPGKALILSALSISFLDYSSIKFSDVPNSKDVEKLLGNQLVIDSGRLVICVFNGYLLPGMATRGSAQASSDIVALVVSLFTAITSELFYIYKSGRVFSEEDNNYVYSFFSTFSGDPKTVWFIVSSSVFLLAIVLLILFLVSAILAGKTVRSILKQRINSALSVNNPDEAEECWEKFEDEALKSWLLCRAGQPQYVIARSVLSSSTGLVVTMCIVLFVAKAVNMTSGIPHFHDKLDWLRDATFVLQCIFLLLGGWVIFRRWFMAVIYFPLFFRRGVKCSPSLSQCSVEDFWTRSISELINMYDLQVWRREQKPKADKPCCGGISMKVFTFLQLHKLLYLLWAAHKLLVWLSKCCWLFSEMLFASMVMRRALIGNSRSLFYEVDPSVDYQEFMKYKEALEHVCMPGETPPSLWLTNKDAVDQARARIKDGMNLKECKELVALMQRQRERDNGERFRPDENVQLVKDYFPTLNESWWKNTAVSLLKIIIRLESEGKKKGDALKAYKQAWDLMSFVESSNTEQPNTIDVIQVFDFEVDLVSMAADKEFKKLEKIEGSSEKRDGNPIEEELEEAEKQLKAHNLLSSGSEETPRDEEKGETPRDDDKGPQDSKDWNEIAPSYSMYRVCKKLQSLRSENNIRELAVDDLHTFLGDVIADCIEELPGILMRSFREWALEHQEENMWEAFQIVGKCKKVVQDCGMKPKWKRLEETVSESTERQNT